MSDYFKINKKSAKYPFEVTEKQIFPELVFEKSSWLNWWGEPKQLCGWAGERSLKISYSAVWLLARNLEMSIVECLQNCYSGIETLIALVVLLCLIKPRCVVLGYGNGVKVGRVLDIAAKSWDRAGWRLALDCRLVGNEAGACWVDLGWTW